jgi:hypothetical protein
MIRKRIVDPIALLPKAANRQGGGHVPATLLANEAKEVVGRQERLTVRTAVQPIEVEEGRGTLATCARTARRHSEPGIPASPHHRRSAWSRQHEHREEGVAVSSGAQAIGFLLTTQAILPNLPTWRHP